VDTALQRNVRVRGNATVQVERTIQRHGRSWWDIGIRHLMVLLYLRSANKKKVQGRRCRVRARASDSDDGHGE
jgi:hypothetical protein